MTVRNLLFVNDYSNVSTLEILEEDSRIIEWDDSYSCIDDIKEFLDEGVSVFEIDIDNGRLDKIV